MMNRLCRAVMLALVMIVASDAAVHAQPGLTYVTIQDSVKFSLIQEGDTLPASWFAPSYDYRMAYDPICRTHFLFTECKKNGQVLKLLSWNFNRLVNAPQELMSYNSRTVNFLVNAGDTVSFYREIKWYNPTNNRMDTSNYYALDTLEMIVYLVSATDGSPLAQLDSIGVLPRISPGMPTIYGARPIMALVSYVVPPALDGDSVLVGITIRARGDGPDHFTRHDLVTMGVSERLNEAFFQNYLNVFGSVYTKRSIDEIMGATGEKGAVLRDTDP